SVSRTPRQPTSPVHRGSPTALSPARTLLPLFQKGLSSRGSSLGGGVLGLDKMFNLNTAPLVAKVFSNETSMTVVGLVLAAKEACPIEEIRFELFLDLSASHEVAKISLVGFPRSLLLFVRVEHILSGCEFGKMHVVNLSNLAQEIPEIVFLCKTRELRLVV